MDKECSRGSKLRMNPNTGCFLANLQKPARKHRLIFFLRVLGVRKELILRDILIFWPEKTSCLECMPQKTPADFELNLEILIEIELLRMHQQF